MAKVNMLDLTAEQTARIERAIGYPVDQWKQAPKGELFPLILHEVKGEPVETFSAMTLRQLVDLVALDEAEGNPTPPSAPGA